MSYDGANHAVKRLQLEMTGYYFTVVHRPGRMLEDANFLSRISEEVTIDPLLKDYLSFARQIYTDNTPPKDELTHQNTPGRRKRKAEEIDPATKTSGTHYATLCHRDTDYRIIDCGNDSSLCSQLIHIPIQYSNDNTQINLERVNSNNHEYTTAAAVTSSMYWVLSEPKFGHWLEICCDNSIPFYCIAAVESLQECRNTLQHKYNIQSIFPTINKALEHGPSTFMKFHIQGYY